MSYLQLTCTICGCALCLCLGWRSLWSTHVIPRSSAAFKRCPRASALRWCQEHQMRDWRWMVFYMGVSYNEGSPKQWVSILKSYLVWMIWGYHPLFRKPSYGDGTKPSKLMKYIEIQYDCSDQTHGTRILLWGSSPASLGMIPVGSRHWGPFLFTRIRTWVDLIILTRMTSWFLAEFCRHAGAYARMSNQRLSPRNDEYWWKLRLWCGWQPLVIGQTRPSKCGLHKRDLIWTYPIKF